MPVCIFGGESVSRTGAEKFGEVRFGKLLGSVAQAGHKKESMRNLGRGYVEDIKGDNHRMIVAYARLYSRRPVMTNWN